MKVSSGAIVRVLAVAPLTALWSTATAQQAYPSRPIRFVIPYAPGGSTTAMARLVGQHLTGQNVMRFHSVFRGE